MLSINLQTHSRMRWRAFADTSTLSTSSDASTNARTYAQQRADADVSMNASAKVSVCIHGRVHVHGNVLVCTSLLCCLCIQSFPNYSYQRAAGGRGEQLAITPVPRTSSRPVRQLKLDACALSASSNSYNWVSAISCPSCWTLVSFCHFSETGRLISSSV